HSGEIDEVVLYKDAEKAGKIRGWIYSVHVGSWGGMLTRLLTFIAALIGATLPLTGYYLWIKRIWRKKSRVN
ncbi:PepSY domain-containing protein, partial [Phocaeicola dorei]